MRSSPTLHSLLKLLNYAFHYVYANFHYINEPPVYIISFRQKRTRFRIGLLIKRRIENEFMDITEVFQDRTMGAYMKVLERFV